VPLTAVLLGVLAAVLLWWSMPATEPLVVLPPPPRPVGPTAKVQAPAAPSARPAPRPENTGEAVPPAPAPEPPDDEVHAGLAWMTIDVVDADGRPAEGASVQPDDCPGFGYHPAARLHFAQPGRCHLRAIRRDGALFARSEPELVELRSGHTNYVQLKLASVRTGGIGIRFRPGGRGMRVLSIVEGAPAWDAGLEVGDEVVSVDGEAVNGMSSEEFIERMTGAEGTDVVFEVLYQDDDGERVEEVSVTRRFLDG